MMITQLIERVKRNPAFYPLAGTVLIPLGIWMFKPVVRMVWDTVDVVIFLMPLILFLTGMYRWKTGDSVREILFSMLVPLPPGYIYGTDVKNKQFPVMTVTIIAICVLLFFCLSDADVQSLMFLPRGYPSGFQILISFFTSAFLHGDFSHLSGNMIILWVVGSNLESRLDSSRFCWIYVLCLIASQIFVILLLVFGNRFSDYHSLGASGAISGLMGLFMVRCFFVRLKISMPVFSLPFFSIPLKIQGMALLGFLFTLDLFGAFDQVYGYEGSAESTHINYLAHVGGYLGGFVLGFMMKLHLDGAEESKEVKAERYSQNDLDREKATVLYQEILAQDPFHEAALEFFLNLNRYSPDKAVDYYVPLIHHLLITDFDKAIALFEEHHPFFTKNLSGPDLTRLGLYFDKQGDLFKARICLEFASGKQGEWQAKSLFQLARVFEKIGNPQMAIPIYDTVATRFPDTHFSREAIRRLSVMRVMDMAWDTESKKTGIKRGERT